MTLSLRQRIVLSLLPAFVLLALLGAAAAVLLYRLGNRIDAILRENYDSVIYMEDLNEALERIDSSFTFALAGEESKARKQYDPSWEAYNKNLAAEDNNRTIHPQEDLLVDRLLLLSQRYHHLGDAFYAHPAKPDLVLSLEALNEALERIDSSFQFRLAGEDKRAREQYGHNWEAYRAALQKVQSGAAALGAEAPVKQLAARTRQYRDKGEAFYAGAPGNPNHRREYFGPGGLLNTFNQLKESLAHLSNLARGNRRHQDYFGANGLYATFQEIKTASKEILDLNANNMTHASEQAKKTARDSLIWLGAGVVTVIALLAAFIAWPIRAVLRPIRAVTDSALAIGGGNLDQVVPVSSHDELGQLAEAFNTMARQLRHYRRTDYSRLLRAQRTSQATIDSFPDPVVVVNEEGCVEMANPAAQRLFGVAGRGPEGTGPPPWQPPAPLVQPLAGALRDQRPYVPEGFDRLVTVHGGGRELAFLPRVLPIRDPYGNTLGAAVLLEDVTRFRLLDQVKSNLVATVSHELKTPLTSVRLALHLLLEEACGPLTPKQTELLLDARENAERLLDRVNHLLDLARLEEQHEALDLRPRAPADLLRDAAEGVRHRAQDKGVDLVVEAAPDLPAVAADAQRLGHALDNLLDNALYYTERGGRITLAAAADDGHVMLSVADTGLGIPGEYLPRVFERFFRVPEHGRHEGTGLGLAIVREIVQAHGGTITCESQPGVGTVFRIRLPAWTGTPGPESIAPPDGRAALPAH
jgi:signal transduction histidine kinase